MSSLPSRHRRIDAFDGLRALAALGVYYCHVGNDIVLPPLVIRGHAGVHLFFVLSGYLLFSPFLKSLLGHTVTPSTAQFYARRFLRIYPPYLVALLIFCMIRVITHLKPPNATNLLSHVFLIFNYFNRDDFFSINAAFWTLAIEVQFYLLLPLIVAIAVRLWGSNERSARFLIFSLISIGIGVRIAEFIFVDGQNIPVERVYPRFTTVFAYLDLFALGMLGTYISHAEVSNSLHESKSSRIALISIGVMIILVANFWSYQINANGWLLANNLTYTASYPVLVCLGFSLILLAVSQTPESERTVLTWRPLVFLGQNLLQFLSLPRRG